MSLACDLGHHADTPIGRLGGHQEDGYGREVAEVGSRAWFRYQSVPYPWPSRQSCIGAFAERHNMFDRPMLMYFTAQISSPADSALLYYKLNKLQQSQNTSPAHSLSASPYPPFGNNSPSPNQLAQMQSRHGQSLSMAQPPTQHSPVPITPSFNPFGPGSTIGDSPDPASRQLEEIHAPQGRVPVTAASLSLPPASQSRPDSRPNFALGFGLEVPEEADEDEEYMVVAQEADEEVNGDGDDGYEQEGYDEHDEQEDDDRDTDAEDNKDDTTTAGHSRLHSRHVSNALSLASVGGNSLPMDFPEDPDQDAIGEWTGSEDLHFDGGSGDEVCNSNELLRASPDLKFTGKYR